MGRKRWFKVTLTKERRETLQTTVTMPARSFQEAERKALRCDTLVWQQIEDPPRDQFPRVVVTLEVNEQGEPLGPSGEKPE